LAEICQKDQKTGHSLGFALETEPDPLRRAKDEDSDRRPSPETDWTSRECSEPLISLGTDNSRGFFLDNVPARCWQTTVGGLLFRP
jgi:hypothetical protein